MGGGPEGGTVMSTVTSGGDNGDLGGTGGRIGNGVAGGAFPQKNSSLLLHLPSCWSVHSLYPPGFVETEVA